MKLRTFILAALILIALPMSAQSTREQRGDAGPLEVQLSFGAMEYSMGVVFVTVRGGTMPYTLTWRYGSQSGSPSTNQYITPVFVTHERGATFTVIVSDSGSPTRTAGWTIVTP